MKRQLSKREKILIIIFILTSVFGSKDIIKKIQHNKENIAQSQISEIEEIRTNFNENDDKDIILKIEEELKNIVTINYINKNSYSDENNNKINNIELQVSARIDNIFYIEDALKNINLEKNINKIEIVKNTQNINEEEEIINDYVNCIIEIKGI